MKHWKRIAGTVASVVGVGLLLGSGGSAGCGGGVTGQVVAAVFSPAPGNYISDVKVSLTTTTDGATIYFTTDGTTPTKTSTVYSGPISVSGNGTSETIKALAVKSGMKDSDVTSGTYTIHFLANPSSDASSRFGAEVKTLATGNIVVTDPVLNTNGHTATGAVYLFDGKSGSLISTLTGDADNEGVGLGGIGVLNNGNFVAISNFGASDPTHPGHGATFVNGMTGLNDVVSINNTLVQIPNTGADATPVPCLTGQPALPKTTCRSILSNIINGFSNPTSSPLAANGSPFNLGLPPAIQNETAVFMPLPNDNYLLFSIGSGPGGAVTFGNGTTGISGQVSAANSILGQDGDMLGIGVGGILTPCGQVGQNVFVLPPPNGDYFITDASACGTSTPSVKTVGFGTTGTVGSLPTSSSFTDNVTITRLNNGNYTLSTATDVTLVDAGLAPISTLTTGFASTVTALKNGDFVVTTPGFNGGAGAATFVNGTTGLNDAVSASNSLVGSATDAVGSGGVKELANGNYVVSSPLFGGGEGAVTLGLGGTGTVGVVDASNSLVGGAATDAIGGGGVTPLTNGNYVIFSPAFGSGVGAVTFASGTTPAAGTVTAANSLVGSVAADGIASKGIVALTKGNYVVISPNFGGGVGAVTFGDGEAGTVGTLSPLNSLVGTSASDHLGSLPAGFSPNTSAVTALTNGGYVVTCPQWSSNIGAVTFGSPTAGVAGGISSSNSLVGNVAGDKVGGGAFHDETILDWHSTPSPNIAGIGGGAIWPANSGDPAHTFAKNLVGVVPLTNGGYVVMSPNFGGGVGAATFGNGTTGVVGTVSGANSLVGSSGDDHVSGGGVVALSTGNYVVLSPMWSNGGTAFGTGAATFGNGTTGISGLVSADNSLVGASAGDFVGFTGRNILTGLGAPTPTVTGATIYQTLFAQGGGSNNSAADISQFGISSANVFFPGQIVVMSNGDYVVKSPFFGNELGAATVGSGQTGVSGVISGENSLIGSVPHGYLGVNVQEDTVNHQAVVSGSAEMAHGSSEIFAQQLP